MYIYACICGCACESMMYIYACICGCACRVNDVSQ